MRNKSFDSCFCVDTESVASRTVRPNCRSNIPPALHSISTSTSTGLAFKGLVFFFLLISGGFEFFLFSLATSAMQLHYFSYIFVQNPQVFVV